MKKDINTKMKQRKKYGRKERRESNKGIRTKRIKINVE
jgi:hypothetical protein